MGGGGDSGSSGGGDTRVRYPGYMEDVHKTLLSTSENLNGNALAGNVAYTGNPYHTTHVDLDDPDEAFFGVAGAITDYPSLYGTFETYVTDVDLTNLYDSILDDMVNSSVIASDVATELDVLNTEITQVVQPRINAGYRDLNAVMSTGFIHSKALIESNKLVAINKYATQMKVKAQDAALQRWQIEVQNNVITVETLMRLTQLYYSNYYDWMDQKAEFKKQSLLWGYTILDIQKSFLGALSGGVAGTSGAMSGPSKGSRAISGALGGAAIGFQVSGGNPIGAAIGGVAGLIGGLL